MTTSLQNLPPEIIEFLASKKTVDKISLIVSTYDIKEKGANIAEIIGKIVLKEKFVSDLPKLIEQNLELTDQEKVRKISTDIANLLLEVKHYVAGTEDLIKSLGGTVPEAKAPVTPVASERFESPYLQEKESIAQQPKIQDNIKVILIKNPQIGRQEIGKEKIYSGVNGVEIAPTIENWLSDYDYFLGAGWHSNLDRIKYLGQNDNARKLGEEDKNILSKILESYDNEISLPFSLSSSGLIDFGNQKEEETPQKSAVPETLTPEPPPSLKEDLVPPQETLPQPEKITLQEEAPMPPQIPQRKVIEQEESFLKPPLPPKPLSATPEPLKKKSIDEFLSKPPVSPKPEALPQEPPIPPKQFPPVPKENIINLKEKTNGTIPGSSIYRR